MMEKTLAVIMAGGRGERLGVLSNERAKPAVPFAGKYRIIDFTLSNCVNSGIPNVVVLTQYRPLSLVTHIGVGAPWGFSSHDKSIQLLHPFLSPESGRNWYKGTADAVYQNLQQIHTYDADFVLVLGGDHIYKMDYSWMFKFHQEKQADITLAYTHVPEAELPQFGTVQLDDNGLVIGFEEKVPNPKSNLVSMGIYLFNKEVLLECLEADAKRRSSKHDFGRDILPRMVGTRRLFGYDYQGYWRDVGTIQSYWQTSMDMINMAADGYLSDIGWPIRTVDGEQSPSVISGKTKVVDSLVSNGCILKGRVERSILSPCVKVAEGAVVKDSVILSEAVIGANAVVENSIIDKNVIVGEGSHIGGGDDLIPNKEMPALSGGFTIVGKQAKIPPRTKIGRNCVIDCKVEEADFPSKNISSGETVKAKG